MIERTPNGPYTMAEAKALNELGTRTGGCADCILEANSRRKNGHEVEKPTQWKEQDLAQDPRWPHRMLCPAHLEKTKA